MVELTESARAQLEKFFEDREAGAIRIYLSSGGWAGPRLSLALDEPRDDDEVFDTDGFKFVVEKRLFEHTGKLTVDMTYFGFSVDAENNPATDSGASCSVGGSCSGGCS